MAFIYHIRPIENWEARANQTSSEFDSYLKDEYRIYTPQGGENCVRILPPSPAWDKQCASGHAPHYGMDVWVHFGVGPQKGSVICLFQMRRGACPICEERARFERAREEDTARELRPVKRVLVFMINRKDEAQGVLAWGMPFTLDREIAKACKDRSTGETYFCDRLDDGYDIYFDREGQQLTTKYTGVALAKRPSPVSQKAADWLETHAIPDALNWRDYAEVKRIYEGAGRGEAPGEAVGPRSRSERREPDSGRREPDSGRRDPPTRAAQPNGGSTAEPELDEGPPFEPPYVEEGQAAKPERSSDGKVRADALRARFGPKT